jgi:hypothetical protein
LVTFLNKNVLLTTQAVHCKIFAENSSFEKNVEKMPYLLVNIVASRHAFEPAGRCF